MPAPLDLDSLRARHANGEHFDYVFFWGHRASVNSVDQHCLSQWFAAGFTLDGVHYPTAEHFMMAEKARLFGDAVIRDRILADADPGRVKALGRKISGFDEARWQQERFDIVVRGSLAKFSQNPALAAYLQATGDAVLVEASPYDAIWGIGMAEFIDGADDPQHWLGLNLLGFALMAARQQLREATAR